MGRKTHVYEYHKKHGNIVDYAGFELPVWYEGIVPECKTVRSQVGIFDVSHMGRVIVEGRDAERFLNGLTTNDVSAISLHGGVYSLFCNPRGGIVDDLTLFRLDQARFLVVYNAANRDKNWNWLQSHRGSYEVILNDVSDTVAMFAVQGPSASNLLRRVSGINLESIDRYGTRDAVIGRVPCLMTHSGYTGEDGFELYVWNTSLDSPASAMGVWEQLLFDGVQLGLKPVGLGARDVLRLEAGMCLYGNDIDEETSPLEARLGWVVRIHKGPFIGKEAIARGKQAGLERVRVGFRMVDRGIPRHGQEIRFEEKGIGRVTSGTLSPTLNVGVGMGYVGTEFTQVGQKFTVQIRGRDVGAEVVKLPFYQRRSSDRIILYGEEMGASGFGMPGARSRT